MDGQIPAYLYAKNNSIKTIFFTALFALFSSIFFSLSVPVTGIRAFLTSNIFAFSSLIILTGMLVVVISRVILTAYSKKKGVLYWQYALWILCEIVAMAIFYTLFAKFFPKDGMVRDISEIFRQSLINTALVLLLPYTISWLYFSWKEKSRLLEHMEQEQAVEVHAKTLVAFPMKKAT